MATLTALKFPTTGGADAALGTIRELSTQHLITIHDAAMVTWPDGRKKPKTRQLNDMTAAGAMSGTFWGMLFGLLFFVPLLGAAVGAALGAMSGSMADVGIDDSFIRDVRSQVTPGTSALFLLTSDAVQDRVRDAMRAHDFEIIATNLSSEEEQQLRTAFESEEPVGA